MSQLAALGLVLTTEWVTLSWGENEVMPEDMSWALGMPA